MKNVKKNKGPGHFEEVMNGMSTILWGEASLAMANSGSLVQVMLVIKADMRRHHRDPAQMKEDLTQDDVDVTHDCPGKTDAGAFKQPGSG